MRKCPPFRLSYKGLGEPLCFAASGPTTTTAFYLLQTTTRFVNYADILLFLDSLPLLTASMASVSYQSTSTILSVSMLVGNTMSLILFCSHFRQITEDKEVGKSSPLVRLGTKTGAQIVRASVIVLSGCMQNSLFCFSDSLCSYQPNWEACCQLH